MNEANNPRIGIVILAAGASTRLGRPKQLLKFQGKSLISRAAETAIAADCGNVVVVLGANAEVVKKEIENLPLEIAFNENWQSGLSSSIKIGLKKLLEIENNLSAVVLTLGDQPLVDAEIILRLVKTRRKTQKMIAACEYENATGVPAIFSREMFAELLNLQTDAGARVLIKKYAASEVAKIAVPEAAIDIDTMEDYEKLLDSET
ncbi:MAG: nucleotidyltransferase family protein [Pyrinomonadaceae bacterium]